MKSYTAFKYHHAFEEWSPVITLDQDGVESAASYVYKGERRGIMIPSISGISSLITDTQMDVDTEIRNMRDRSGNPIFLLGYDESSEDIQYVMYVATADPQMDPFGNVVAWRHSIRRAG